MRFRRSVPIFATAVAGLLSIDAAAQAQQPPRVDLSAVRTRAEATGFRETSRHDDVTAFVEAVDLASPLVHLTTFGYTSEGRPLSLAVVGRVPDASPRAVRASGKTVVYLQANIHAGEVEGKEALLVLLREIAAGEHAAWADSLVLLVAPNFNADGNERVSLTNRPHQHGPVGGMGTRGNARELNINRDFTKLDTPEGRSQALLMQAYDPHVLVDLHTTNGTYHGYHLTFAPPLHPNTDSAIVRLLRDDWLPHVTRGARDGDGLNLWYYGNVPDPESRWAAGPGAERGWYSFDHRPRFSSNYWGLRNRFGILSETYSYLPFEERVRVAERFVERVLDYAAANATRIRAAVAEADRRAIAGREMAVAARPNRTGDVEILMGSVTEEKNPYTGEPMLRRAERVRTERMADFSTFAPSETERAPAAWLVPASLRPAVDRLEAHGVAFRRLARDTTVTVEEFRIDSTRAAERASEGRRERRVWGRWTAVEKTVPAGTLWVPADQPLGRLAFTLLEPRSDDGLLAWALLDEALAGATVYPITRVAAPASSPSRPR